MLNIAVFVSGGGTNLQALIDAQKNGIIKNGIIRLVVSSKSGVFALERAKKSGIKSIVVERKSFKNTDDFDNALLNVLAENDIEVIVLAGFLSILGKLLTEKYENRIINVHPALIPSFCGKGMYGLKVHEAVLAYGVKVTGATVHFVNSVPDGGKVIMQKAVAVLDGDTPEILQKRVMEEAEWELLPKATEKICEKLLQSEKESKR